ncbi:hypothetical protein LCGC14_2184130 [marine sediment metagenome]|uniref:Uncharacterized protein n=1 Tax=marine sediment metagenome TaxID=412755 RepID=A0A0F9GH73_9ZZZZ
MNCVPGADCEGCKTTGGVLSCPTHSPSYLGWEQPKPFVHLYIKCPHCGKGIQFDGLKGGQDEKD